MQVPTSAYPHMALISSHQRHAYAEPICLNKTPGCFLLSVSGRTIERQRTYVPFGAGELTSREREV